MNNLTDFTNISSMFTNSTTEDDTAKIKVSYIIAIIINCITCPFTVLLNMLVIMAVKRRPRLQTNANILLACLAATDTLAGLTSQPSFILLSLLKALQLVGVAKNNPVRLFYNVVLRILSICSCLHLMLVTCERLIAIKFTMHYQNIVTKRKIKVAVISCWIISITFHGENPFIVLVVMLCIVFVASTYVMLYLETRRHQKIIKTQQMPREEVERFAKENKALKTTVYVVGAIALCFSPMAFIFIFRLLKLQSFPVSPPWIQTFAMLNSFLNPLIYCWRQTEMRKFVFRKKTQVVYPVD